MMQHPGGPEKPPLFSTLPARLPGGPLLRLQLVMRLLQLTQLQGRSLDRFN